jgi:biotin carboxyl carrier protein
LPQRGQVLVKVGDRVAAEAVVARAEMPGNLYTVRLAQLLHLEPQEIASHLIAQIGDVVSEGDVLARTQGMWGLFKSEVRSPISGAVEELSEVSGHLRLREGARRIEVLAHFAGEVIEVLEGEGAMIEARAALVQGIFGVGGERRGQLKMVTASPSEPLRAEAIDDCAGRVLVAGAGAEGEVIRRAAEAGAAGLVVGAVSDEALRQYVGYDIGVAITGQETMPMTLILTEGFGELPMAQRTWDLLASLEGQLASINGATQIRAGVIRPEIIVTHAPGATAAVQDDLPMSLAVGVKVRLIREPNFGALGRVVALPSELIEIETESRVRIALVELDRGGVVRVPRVNLELI